MGFYVDRVLPRVSDIALSGWMFSEIRARVCDGLVGDVLELGFGSGRNVPHYPVTVNRVRAVDPATVGRRLAAKRLAASPVPVEFVGLDAQQLPIEDNGVDTALTTWTLCSIPDAVAAIREVRRVLRPGGVLHFVEHGRAPDPSVRRWQDRFDPLQQRLACGCHLNRDIPALIAAGGMRVERLDTYYVEGNPKVIGATYEGAAVASA